MPRPRGTGCGPHLIRRRWWPWRGQRWLSGGEHDGPFNTPQVISPSGSSRTPLGLQGGTWLLAPLVRRGRARSRSATELQLVTWPTVPGGRLGDGGTRGHWARANFPATGEEVPELPSGRGALDFNTRIYFPRVLLPRVFNFATVLDLRSNCKDSPWTPPTQLPVITLEYLSQIRN